MYNHTHFSLLQQVTCTDYEDEADIHPIADDTSADVPSCCCENVPTGISSKYAPVLQNFCGTHSVQTLNIKSDVNIEHSTLNTIKYIPTFTIADYLVNLYIDIPKYDASTVLYLISQSPPPRLLLINFIHKISSLQSDDSDYFC
jgi:hypothetical protein